MFSYCMFSTFQGSPKFSLVKSLGLDTSLPHQGGFLKGVTSELRKWR